MDVMMEMEWVGRAVESPAACDGEYVNMRGGRRKGRTDVAVVFFVKLMRVCGNL